MARGIVIERKHGMVVDDGIFGILLWMNKCMVLAVMSRYLCLQKQTTSNTAVAMLPGNQ